MKTNRRKLLEGIAWSTPVIQFIILPVHAQTSGTTTAPTECKTTLTIPGQSVTLCASPESPEGHLYESTLVKRSDGCITIESNFRDAITNPQVSSNVDITIQVYNDLDGLARVSITVYQLGVFIAESNIAQDMDMYCRDPRDDDTYIYVGEFNERLSITDPNGDRWEGQAHTIINGLDITLSDIDLTRA